MNVYWGLCTSIVIGRVIYGKIFFRFRFKGIFSRIIFRSSYEALQNIFCSSDIIGSCFVRPVLVLCIYHSQKP